MKTPDPGPDDPCPIVRNFRGLLPTLARLTPRQNEVLHWLCLGKSRQQIARILHIEPCTVENHLRAIYDLIGADDALGAVVAIYHALETNYLRFIDGVFTPLAEARAGFRAPERK